MTRVNILSIFIELFEFFPYVLEGRAIRQKLRTDLFFHFEISKVSEKFRNGAKLLAGTRAIGHFKK